MKFKKKELLAQLLVVLCVAPLNAQIHSALATTPHCRALNFVPVAQLAPLLFNLHRQVHLC